MFLRKQILLVIALLLTILFSGCDNNNKENYEKKAEIPVNISVKRTDSFLSSLYNLSVYIDNEEVFRVGGNKTESTKIIISEGIHTIQIKRKFNKSKKIKFEVIKNRDNQFFFITEYDALFWGTIKLEKRKYLPLD